jgi:hypothetical protein
MPGERFRPTGKSNYSQQTGRRTQRLIIGGLIFGLLLLVGLGSYTIIQYIDLQDRLNEQLDKVDVEGGKDTTGLESTENQRNGTPTPTRRETPTSYQNPDYALTATAGCAVFQSQFPGTPCPGTAVPGIEITATEACNIFQSQFPGTPCP